MRSGQSVRLGGIETEGVAQEGSVCFILTVHFSSLFSGSAHIWLYCGAVLLDKGPHVLRDW